MRQRVKPWTRWHGGILVPSMSGVGLVESGGGEPGDLVHGEEFVIRGSNFGSKSPVAPLVWDNCSHGQAASARWSAVFPTDAGANLNMAYRVPGTGNLPSVALPHGNISAVLAGSHYTNGTDGGYNVGLSRGIGYAAGKPVYCRYLLRNSSGFFYDNESNENYKIWHWDQGAGPYSSSTDGYIEVKGFTSANSNPYYKYNSGYHLVSPDGLGNTASGWQAQVSGGTIGNAWVEHRWFWVMDKGSGGACYLLVNNTNASGGQRPNSGSIRVPGVTIGKMAFAYHGQTIPSGGSTHYAQIGGYARYNSAGSSFRMFADIYMDDTWSRVELANSATYDSATIIEPQPPKAWSGSEITCTCNKGRLSSGTVHVFVFDSSNSRQYLGTLTMA